MTIMWRFATIFTVLAVIKISEAGKIDSTGKAASGAYAGAVSSGSANSYAGGYGGNYGGSSFNDYDFGGDFGGGFGGIPDPYAFHQQLMASILRQHAAHQNAIVSATSTGDASVNADASFISNNDQEMINRQVAAQNIHAGGNRYVSGTFQNAYKPQGYGSSSGHAAAAGSIGPRGFKQTAYINPPNPASPNIMNRFGASDNDGGFKAVSVSSFSHSSDINGKRTNVRGAQTTVNDNGKISSYTVHS